MRRTTAQRAGPDVAAQFLAAGCPPFSPNNAHSQASRQVVSQCRLTPRRTLKPRALAAPAAAPGFRSARRPGLVQQLDQVLAVSRPIGGRDIIVDRGNEAIEAGSPVVRCAPVSRASRCAQRLALFTLIHDVAMARSDSLEIVGEQLVDRAQVSKPCCRPAAG